MWKLNIKKSILIYFIALMSIVLTAKSSGWLQLGEWAFFDLFFQLRPQEPRDERIVIVGFSEDDIKRLGRYPVSDENLAKVLTKIKQQNPTVIGLDIFRDVPVKKGHKDLVKAFKNTPNLIGIQKVGVDDPVSPPPTLAELGQISTVDTFIDGDHKIRRITLYQNEEGSEDIPNLGLALAFDYLARKGITPLFQSDPNEPLRFGNVVFEPLKSNDGGYANIDDGSYQILSNYRGPANSFKTVSFSDLLNNKVSPTLMTGKIVLVGTTAQSGKDTFFTPYSKELSTPTQTTGVEINANITSQIIASVLDNRPLFRFVPEIIEDLWAMFLTSIIITLIWVIKPSNYKDFSAKFLAQLAFILLTLITGAIGVSYFAFLNGRWLPVFLPLLCLVSSSFSITGYIYLEEIIKANRLLEQKNEQLQNAQTVLETSNYELEKKTLALQDSESKLLLALDGAKTAIFDWDLIEEEISIIHNCSYLLETEDDNISVSFDNFIQNWVYPEDHWTLTDSVSKITEDAFECNFDFRVVRKPDKLHWLAVNGKVYYDPLTGEATRMVGILSDVTERERKGQDAADNVVKQKALTENSFDISMLLDKNLSVTFVSPAIFRILGYLPDEISLQSFLTFIHPEDIDLFERSIAEISLNPANIIQIEYRYLHKDGTWRILESAIGNNLEHPSIVAYVINSRDVTEYQQMKKAFCDIESLVEGLREKLERLMEKNDTFDLGF